MRVRGQQTIFRALYFVYCLSQCASDGTFNLIASIFRLHKSCPDNSQSIESMLLCMVVWHWVEYSAGGRGRYGVSGEFSIHHGWAGEGEGEGEQEQEGLMNMIY